jgi:alanine racemase
VNLVRPGLMLFGVTPEAWLSKAASLKPVLSWKTAVTHVKRIEAGRSVSYGATWTASRDSTIATLPVGYADGFGCVYSNVARVLVRGQSVPVVGRVTMDMCMVDVTDVPSIQLDDEVVLLGQQGENEISVSDLSRWASTIPYETLCSIGARVPRVLVD